MFHFISPFYLKLSTIYPAQTYKVLRAEDKQKKVFLKEKNVLFDINLSFDFLSSKLRESHALSLSFLLLTIVIKYSFVAKGTNLKHDIPYFQTDKLKTQVIKKKVGFFLFMHLLKLDLILKKNYI